MLHVGISSAFELNWFPPTISAVSLHFRRIRGLVLRIGPPSFFPHRMGATHFGDTCEMLHGLGSAACNTSMLKHAGSNRNAGGESGVSILPKGGTPAWFFSWG